MFELWPKPAHGNLAWWATMLSSFGVCLEIEYPSSVGYLIISIPTLNSTPIFRYS